MPLRGWDSIALGLRHLPALLIGRCQDARQAVVNSSCKMLSRWAGLCCGGGRGERAVSFVSNTHTRDNYNNHLPITTTEIFKAFPSHSFLDDRSKDMTQAVEAEKEDG